MIRSVPLPRALASAAHCAAAWLALTASVAADPVSVRTTTVAEVARFPERSAPASVVGLNRPQLSAEIAARIVDIRVKPGEVVDQGALLVTLDCGDYELIAAASAARLEALDAQVALAKQKLARADRLAATQMAAQELLDEREADLARLRAERTAQAVRLKSDRRETGKCRVTSPFPALVLERLASEGDFAREGSPLLELIDLESIEVVAEVYGPDARLLEAGPEFAYVAASERYAVALRKIVGAVDPASRTREVRLTFTGTAALPGSAGKLVWRDPRPHLPAEYLVRRDERLGIFTVNDTVAHFVPIPQAEVGRDVPVDLPADARVVSAGQFALADGDRVEIR